MHGSARPGRACARSGRGGRPPPSGVPSSCRRTRTWRCLSMRTRVVDRDEPGEPSIFRGRPPPHDPWYAFRGGCVLHGRPVGCAAGTRRHVGRRGHEDRHLLRGPEGPGVLGRGPRAGPDPGDAGAGAAGRRTWLQLLVGGRAPRRRDLQPQLGARDHAHRDREPDEEPARRPRRGPRAVQLQPPGARGGARRVPGTTSGQGRLEVGLARSTAPEWRLFNIPPDDARDQMQETFEMLPAIWTEQEFSWDSENFQIDPPQHRSEALPETAPAALAGGRHARWLPAGRTQRRRRAAHDGQLPDRGGRVDALDLPRGDQELRPGRQVRERPRSRLFTFVHCAETEQEAIDNGAAAAAAWYVNTVSDFFEVREIMLRGGR